MMQVSDGCESCRMKARRRGEKREGVGGWCGGYDEDDEEEEEVGAAQGLAYLFKRANIEEGKKQPQDFNSKSCCNLMFTDAWQIKSVFQNADYKHRIYCT